MISVQEASELIQSNLLQPKTEWVDLDEATGRILAENIVADRDFPPFDRVMMDGIAINLDHFEANKKFRIEGMQLAGSEQMELKDPENCLEVMTGAILPMGANAVIPFEELEKTEDVYQIKSDNLNTYQNIHRQGEDEKAGDFLLKPGTKITSAEIGVLATVGKAQVAVYQNFKIAIVSTGDELVGVEETPLEYQIRRSNSHVLKSALKQDGFDAAIFHIKDDRAALSEKLHSIVTDFDVVILSGGVSRGKKDYVPKILEELSVKKLFHRVAQRPGKPFWFGHKDDRRVFALPGNPVSTYLCYFRYIRPWLMASLGTKRPDHNARLATDFNFNRNLTYFLQIAVTVENGIFNATPVVGKGSGDLANLIKADGFLELPADQDTFKAGEVFPLILYRTF